MESVPTNVPTTSNPLSDATIRLGTRASALARWQADWVAARLTELGAKVELVFIKTGGDGTTTPITQSNSQGLFTKEIQRALLDDRVDLAVHSLKDLPTECVEGLGLVAVPGRESPRDAFLSNRFSSFKDLPEGARVGTGSRRRQSQLLHARPDLKVLDIRGNVETRLQKLDNGEFDAIILAEAGLNRLGLVDRITQILPPSVMLPAVGQGALGLETRLDDSETMAAVTQLDDPDTHACVLAERTLLLELRGGCLAPVGAWGRVEDGELHLDATVLSTDGATRLVAKAQGDPRDAVALGASAARQLIEMGAATLIAAARND
ncbi:MAG: hydroxymethylbilane synthase [Planctomycetaceae bacterium]|nr:hydroxymethylbilane synthase [Planctomycetales bacterium]MCB9923370.1 hydroxymethylbilane synthase [Planctomycetaceae bacterium]